MKIVKLFTIICFSFILVFTSCNTSQQSTDFNAKARTKNGRFVKYKKHNSNKNYYAFKGKKKRVSKSSRTPLKNADEKTSELRVSPREEYSSYLADNSKDKIIPRKKKQPKYFKAEAAQNDVMNNISTPPLSQNTKSFFGKQKNNFLGNEVSNTAVNENKKSPEWISIIGLIFSTLAAISLFTGVGVGFFLTFAVVGMVMGIIGLIRIQKSPNRLSGRGYAIAAISIGGTLLIGLILLVILFLSSGTF